MKLKNIHIFLIVAVFGSVLYVVAWSGSQWHKFRGPDLLRVSRSGELYISALNRIFVYNAKGIYQQSIDLTNWGIEQSTGGFDIFSNGDILMLEGSHHQGPLLELLTYLRMEKLLVAHASESSDGRYLVRCSPSTLQCARLPGLKRTFTNTFRVLVDAQDRFFLADTARDAVSFHAADGALLDEIKDGFRFPNQITLESDDSGNNFLLVANTNFNEVTRIPFVNDRFAAAADWQHLKVDGAIPSITGHIWPLEIVALDDARYVLQQGNGMANGLLVKYDKTGNLVLPFTMPAHSDAMAVVWFGEELLVADYEGMKVWRYAADGTLKGELASYELESFLQKLAGQRAHYQSLEKIAWRTFFVLFLVGFVGAIIGERRAKALANDEQVIAVSEATRTLDVITQQGESDRPSADDPAIHWIAKDARRVRMIRMLFLSMVVLMLLVTLLTFSSFYSSGDNDIHKGKALRLMYVEGGMSVFIMFFVYFLDRISQKTGLGVLREWVILRSGFGKTAIGRGEDILLFPTAIAVEDVVLNTGQRTASELPQKSLFDKVELQEWLAPRLMRARELSGIDLMKWYFSHKFAQTVLTIVLTFLLIGARIWQATHH